MISKVLPTVRPDLIHTYLAWVDAWILSSTEKPSHESLFTLDELADLFTDDGLYHLLSHETLMQAVHSFRHHITTGKVKYGEKAPSCNETNLLSEQYNPQTDCKCDKAQPLKDETTAQQQSQICGAHEGMLDALTRVLDRKDEWNSTDLFTTEKLTTAVNELLLANTETHYVLDTCQGPRTSSLIPEIQAPDRRPNPGVDGNKIISNQLYPTAEAMKMCTDAKYYGVIASGAGLCDEGLARAVADSCNDILIGDYCEAADPKGLKLLQQTGAAAISFLKLCNMAGRVSDWQFENLAAYMIQCRVLGYFKDHERARLPCGIYGSRMTGLAAHRHIDGASFHGVVTASIATGQELKEREFMRVAEACVYINDFVDFRGDIMRKQRENPLVRGMRGDLCRYLDRMIGQCLDSAIEAIETSEVGALVVMAYCNWAMLGSHHKVYEVLHGVRRVEKYSACEYESQINTARYDRLLLALQPYGTLGKVGPRVTKKRIEMDKVFSICRTDPETNLAWLADATRSLLDPTVLRQIVDVVHFEWRGDVGMVNYCP